MRIEIKAIKRGVGSLMTAMLFLLARSSAVMKFLSTAVLQLGFAVIGSAIALAADAPQTNLQLTMLTKINPQGLALWDITNGALDADGKIAGSKLTAANWMMLLEIGKAIEEGGRALANTRGVAAAAPGAKLQDESNPGASTAADVQRYIDAEPAVFRSHALELQKTGALVIEAAKKRDTQRLSAVSNELDEVCESCHMKFWYPQQAK